MYTQVSSRIEPGWTWADQISTYRFWGLFFFYILAGASSTAISSFMFLKFTQENIPLSMAGGIFSGMAIAGLAGLGVSFLAIRWKTKLVLVATGVTLFLGSALLLLPSGREGIGLIIPGAILFGLANGVLWILIPALMAGGRGGAEAFVVVVGLMFFLNRIESLMVNTQLGSMVDQLGFSVITIVVLIWNFLGLILLLPVNPAFFTGPPPERNKPLPPVRRDPWVSGLLFLVPFYWLYWTYRAHGEVCQMTASRKILTPRAAVVGSIFLPYIIFAFELTSLTDALNDQAMISSGTGLSQSPLLIFLLGIFLPPVGVGKVQAQMNRALEAAQAQRLPVA